MKGRSAEIRGRIVLKQRSGAGGGYQRNSTAFNVHKSTVDSIIEKGGRSSEQPRRRVLVRYVTKNLMVTLAELHRVAERE